MFNYISFKNSFCYTLFSRKYKQFYCINLIICTLLVSGCGKNPMPIAPQEVWKVVRHESGKYNIEPSFIFAIAFAESRFDAHANSRHARGIMQLSKTEESRFLEHSLECGCKPILSIVTRYPGGLLLNASNFRDSENPIIVRDKEGNFFGIQMDKFTALFFFNLLDCKKIHP